MTNLRRLAGDERGAVLVHAALAMLTLIAFSAFVIDYGALLVSRNQAQNAADAAALAGASSLAFDDADDIARAKDAAAAAGIANQVWDAAPSILPATDVQLIPCPPGAPGLPDTCIRANVYRSVARSNALPVFAQIVGLQDVRATATAQVTTGNAVECLKPWAVADRWDENWEDGAPNDGPWTPDSVFDKYVRDGGNWVLPVPPIPTPDVYRAPSKDDPGTGFTPFDANGDPTPDYGLPMTLKIGSGEDRLSSGWFQSLDLPNPNCSSVGVNCYRENIANCNPNVFAIGDSLPVETGNFPRPTVHAVEGGGPVDMGLNEKDPHAFWDDATKSIQGSCAPGVCADGQYYARSPRIVPVPLFDIDAFFAGSPNGKPTITITNIIGFFIESAEGNGFTVKVTGYLVAIPGLTKGTTSVDDTASFLRKVLLVR